MPSFTTVTSYICTDFLKPRAHPGSLGTQPGSLWGAAEGLRGEAMCAPWRAGELWPVSDHVLTETQLHLQDGEGLWGAATGHDQERGQ